MKNKKPNASRLLRSLMERLQAINTSLLDKADISTKTVDFTLCLYDLVKKRDPEAQVMVNHNLDFVIVTGCPLPLLREDIADMGCYLIKAETDKKVWVMDLDECPNGGHRRIIQLIQGEA